MEEVLVNCIGCRTPAPEVGAPTDLTKIHGWRLFRRLDRQRNLILDWRCSDCALRYRELRRAAGLSSGCMRMERLAR